MKPSIKLFTIRGIDVGIHYSWFFILILVTWTLADGFYPRSFPDWTEIEYWGTGLISAFALFGSVLLHELAHSFVAQSKGIPVSSITLMLIGGVSNITAPTKRASTEFQIAVVGPLTSAGLSIFFLAVLVLIGPQEFENSSPFQGMIFYLAYINLLLAAFNLVPGYPLDGGRILRSIVWAVTDDEGTAMRAAGWSGQIVGWMMIGIGVYMALGGETLGGLWIAFIGWILQGVANTGTLEYQLSQTLKDIRISEVMSEDAGNVHPDLTVTDLITGVFVRANRRYALVIDDGAMIGIITLSDVHRRDSHLWDYQTVRDVMTPAPIHTISAEEMVDDALKLLTEHDVNQLPVMRDGRIVGVLLRESVLRYFQILRDSKP